jgi:hypothetical protein
MVEAFSSFFSPSPLFFQIGEGEAAGKGDPFVSVFGAVYLFKSTHNKFI